MQIRTIFIYVIFFTMGGMVQATTTLGEVTMGINMVVTDVTCSINNTKGISQQIIMPIVSHDTLIKNSAQNTEVPLLIDCRSSASQPTSVSIRLNPGSAGTLVGDGSNGILKTDLTGIGIKLTWKNMAGHPPASLLPGHDTVFTTAFGSEGIWDLSLFAQPVLVSGETPEMGRYTGALQISLKYY